MKRKLSPEKESDISLDNQKVARIEHNDTYHPRYIVMMAFLFRLRLILMDNGYGTNNYIYICNMYMFSLITNFMLYNNILLNSVLLTLNGIILYISDVPLWSGVRMHLMVTKLEYVYQFPIES